MQPTPEQLSKLLMTLYAAPMRPELWTTFLEDLNDLLGLPAAAILHQDLTRKKYGFSTASGLDPAAQASYDKYFGQVDPFRPRFLTKPEGQLALAEDLCPGRVLRKTELYGDYLTKYDFTLYCSMATIKQPGTGEFISIYRGLRSREPHAETLTTIGLVLPHIRGALQLRRALSEVNTYTRNYAEVLNSLNVGVILLNERGDCLFISTRAEAACAGTDGIYIRNSRIQASTSANEQALRTLIGRAIGVAMGKTTRPCGTISIPRADGPPLRLTAISLSPEAPLVQLTTSQVAAAAVFIRDPRDDITSLPKLLSTTYGLTVAEARLATQLHEGHTLALAAERNQVSIETVRAQLKSVFAKVQVRRQTDLLRLLGELLKTIQN